MREAAGEQRQAFEDERTLLRRDVAALAGAIESALAEFAAKEPAKCDRRLVEVARNAPVSRLEDVLRRTVESAVRESFERFRQAEAQQAEESWRQLAERFRDRTQARVNAVRAAAADIFQVELPQLAVPQVAEERERYFYFFVHVGSSTESIDRLARRLLPPAIVRRRLLERAWATWPPSLTSTPGVPAGTSLSAWTPCASASKWPWRPSWTAPSGPSWPRRRRAEELRSMAEAERQQHKRASAAARQAAARARAGSRHRRVMARA